MSEDKPITSLADVKLPTPEELGVAPIEDEGEGEPVSQKRVSIANQEKEGDAKPASEEKTPEEVAYTDVELQAMDRGWTPKDQFKGDPATWRPADIYVEQGLLMDKVSSSNKKVSQLQQAVDNMTTMIEKQSKMALSKEKSELVAQRRNAIADSDIETVELYDERIKQLEEPPAQQKTPPATQEVKDFVYRNMDWFNTDSRENEDMRKLAIDTGDRLARNYPSFTEAELLPKVKEAVVKAYPHRFNVRTPVPRKAVQQKVEGASQHREVKTTGITYKDLPHDLKNMVDNIWRASNKRISKDKYAQELERTGAVVYE